MLAKNNSISQTAKILSLSKDTLRYYDKLGLVRPTRGENRYRFYTDMDVLLLKYVEVMKFAGLSLSQIGTVLYDVVEQTEENKFSTLGILKKKREELNRKILLYQEIEYLLDQVIQDLGPMSCPEDMIKVDDMINRIYTKLRSDEIFEEMYLEDIKEDG